MLTFVSQLSTDQLTHLAQKSVARASRKYSAGFIQAALNETDKLSDVKLRQLVEMPDFGESRSVLVRCLSVFHWRGMAKMDGAPPLDAVGSRVRNAAKLDKCEATREAS
jgi:hypothetical protein